MEKKEKIVVVGSINYDIVIGAERLPGRGETVRGGGLDLYTGGKGANQAVQAALLGLDTALAGKVGDDAQGRTVLAALRDKGVDTSLVETSPGERTGCALITVAPDGSNTIVHAPGANHTITRSLIDAGAARISGAGLVIFQNEINQDALLYGLETARRLGSRTLLNPAPAVELPEAAFPLVDYIAPNETESRRYTGIAPEGMPPEAWRRKNAEWFRERGVKNVCITLGESGAYFLGEEGGVVIEKYEPAFPVKPVDTTAAGDSFIGGFAFALVRGWPVERALAFANACGAVSVTVRGAQASIQPYAQVAAFLSTRGIFLSSL